MFPSDTFKKGVYRPCPSLTNTEVYQRVVTKAPKTLVRPPPSPPAPPAPPSSLFAFLRVEGGGLPGIAAGVGVYSVGRPQMSVPGARPKHPSRGAAGVLQRELPHGAARLRRPRGPGNPATCRRVAGV